MAEKRYGRILAVMLAAVFALAGCGNQPGGTQGDASLDEKAMGRYVEENYDLESKGRKGGMIRLEDGRLEVFDFTYGPFISENDGKTWGQLYDDWLTNYGADYCREAALSQTGEIFLIYTPIDHVEKSEEAAENESEWKLEIKYALVSPEGERKELKLSLESTNEEFLSKCWFTRDGRLIASKVGSIVEIDKDTGDVRELFETEGMVEYACFSADRMAAFTRTAVLWYDLNAGELLEQDKVLNQFIADITDQGNTAVSFTGNNYTFLAALDEENNLYIVYDRGIFRHVPGGSTLEQLLTGSLYTLGNPSESLYGMVLYPEGEFMVLFGDSVSRFQYDADMPSIPEKELKVYSLKNNTVMQQAVSDYQKSHPEIYVNYIVGMTGMDGQTSEDAIKVLNTEILAGKGPDVLLLDGLPIDSYLSKGMLADISGVVNKTEEKEGLIDSIARTYERDGKICAVPLRFAVPIMVGQEKLTGTVKDLKTLADYIEEQRKVKPEGSILQTFLPDATLRLLAITSASAWTKEDGSLDREAVTDFLTQANRIYQAEKQGVTQDDIEQFNNTGIAANGNMIQNFYKDASRNVLEYTTDQSKLAMGTTQCIILDFSNIISAGRMVEGMDFVSMPGQSENVFVADTIAGLSAKSGQMDLAEEFLMEMFSAKTFTALGDSDEGFSINDKAREAIYRNYEPGTVYGQMSLPRPDGTFSDMDCFWPEEEEMNQLSAMMEKLDTPYLPGGFLEEEVIATGTQVLGGSLSVEDGVDQIEKKVQLYLAE